ncbi:MAG: glycosyltransferase family 4 protein [Cyanobacteria bacterium REEB65]|nr:glycosyltransferase family 4 protein [Cyanobacteria bacterium REEB65]
MRIGMLSWEYPPRIVGGIARHVEELSQALVRRGHEVHVFTADHPNTAEHEEVAGVHLHRTRGDDAPCPDFLSSILHLNFGMARMFFETQRMVPFDLVHAHDWLAAQSADLLKRSLELPLIATIHATEAGRNKGIHNAFSRYIAQQEWFLTFDSYRIITCSQTMRHEVGGQFQVPDDKIDTIPNGVDGRKFHFEFSQPERLHFRRRLALDFEKIVLFVGRMVPEKGAQFLLEAAPRVLARHPDAKFVIVGKGGFLDELKARAAALRLGNKCLFTGYVDDDTLVRLYRIADCFVAPSLYEPFGIVALEGMAASVPVVASDAGGLWEVVEHDVSGISTYAGNVDSLAWGILQVLQRPDHAQWLVANARDRVERVFNWDRIAEKTEQCYQRVLGDRFAGGPLPSERVPAPFPHSAA